MTGLVLAWCRLYTAAVPEAARDRRREELESHLWEASTAGRPGWRSLADALRGSIDDLRWCADERRRAGLAPAVFGATGSLVVAGVLMAVAYGLSALPGDPVGDFAHLLPRVAAIVLGLSFADRLRRGFRKRSG